MKDNSILEVIFFILLGVIWGALAGAGIVDSTYRKWAVRVNIAEYDAKTGEWTLRPEFREKE